MPQLVQHCTVYDSDSTTPDHHVVVWRDENSTHPAKLEGSECSDPSEVDVNKLDPSSNECHCVCAEHCHGAWNQSYTEAPHGLSELDYFLKRPSLLMYDGTNIIGNVVTSEVEIMEVLSKKPHPNIVRYYGCQRDGDYITGIWPERYQYTLEELIDGDHELPEDQITLDTSSMMEEIRSAIAFIHSLGLVHDDINPSNIMVDENMRPTIIDFNSCKRPGERSRGGTPGWSQSPETVEFENDMFALELIKKYLDGKYTPDPDGLSTLSGSL